jgi:hypothetical protein
MDIRFALTQQALAAAVQHGAAVSLFLDGVLVWERWTFSRSSQKPLSLVIIH